MGKPKFSWHRHVVIMSVINYFYGDIWENLFLNTFYTCSMFRLFTFFLKFQVHIYQIMFLGEVSSRSPLLHLVTVTDKRSGEDW